MREKVTGSLSLVAATIIWGFAFIAQSVGMDRIGPFTFQAVRCLLAVLVLFPASFLLERKSCGIRTSWNLWKDKRLWKSGLLCGVCLFVAATLQQIGLIYTDAGKAGFLTAMYIVLVPIFGIFLGQKIPKSALFSVLMAVVGLYLLSCAGVDTVNVGDLCLMGCALGFTVQILCIDRVAQGLDGVRLNCIQALTVVVLSLPFAAVTETIVVSDLLACWKSLCFAGILSMGVAYTLQIQAQKKLDPTAASLLMSLESVFAVLGGWWLLDERMTPAELLGCCLVFAAVVISQLPERKA